MAFSSSFNTVPISDTTAVLPRTNEFLTKAAVRLSGGNTVLAWLDPEDLIIKTQVYDPAGDAVGAPGFNSTRGGGSDRLEVSALPGGGFVVGWRQGTDGGMTGPIFQVFDQTGTKVGNIVELEPVTYTTMHNPHMTVLEGGQIVWVWVEATAPGSASTILHARMFGADGSATTDAFTIGTHDDLIIIDEISATSGGGFIISTRFERDPTNPSSVDSLKTISIDNSGSHTATTIIYAVSPTDYDQFARESTVLGLPDGTAVVVWTVATSVNVTDIWVQRLDANGALLGDAFRANGTPAVTHNYAPALASLPGGGFVVTWMSPDIGNSSYTDVRGQVFDANGIAVGGQFVLPETDLGQGLPTIVGDAGAKFTVFFDSYERFVLDGHLISKVDMAVEAAPVIGTEGSDNLTPQAMIDISYDIDSLGGDDVVTLRGGNDLITGGAGDDTIDGGGGSDTARYSGYGDDYVVATNGDGSVSVADQRAGMPDGSDTLTHIEALQFGDGIRFLNAGGKATIDANGSLVTPATVSGGTGADFLDIDASALPVASAVTGGVSADGLSITFDFDGNGTIDLLVSGVEEIRINGQDVVIAGDFSQTGLADDTIFYSGTENADRFDASGVTSNEHIVASGGKGNDELRGGIGPSDLRGDDGDDLLVGGTGNDALNGGSGIDTVYYDGPRQNFLVAKGSAGQLHVQDLRNNGSANLGMDVVSGVELFAFGETLFAASDLASGAAITGTEANDIINTKRAPVGQPKATALEDIIHGNGGNDAIDGGAGADEMHGGLGNDSFTIDTAGDQAIELADGGIDTMKSAVVDFTLAANIEKGTLLDVQGIGADLDITGNDLANTLTGNRGANALAGGEGKDVLNSKDGNDTLNGDGGDDKLNGGNGDDILYGGAGIDFLTGGAGADTLTGGSEADQFKFDKFMLADGLLATDTITDFSGFGGEGDRINLSAIDANGNALDGNQKFAFLGTAAFGGVAGQLRYEQSGGDTHVFGDIDGDTFADFQIIANGSLTFVAADFIL